MSGPFEVAQQLVGALHRLDFVDHLLIQRAFGVAQRLPELRFDLFAGEHLHDAVAADPDRAMDLPDRHDHPVRRNARYHARACW